MDTQRSKPSWPASDCHASSHPLHLLRPAFVNNEIHQILFLLGNKKLFLMLGTFCSQLLAILPPSRPSGLRVNATSLERPFLTPPSPPELLSITSHWLFLSLQLPEAVTIWFNCSLCFLSHYTSSSRKRRVTPAFSTVAPQYLQGAYCRISPSLLYLCLGQLAGLHTERSV